MESQEPETEKDINYEANSRQSENELPPVLTVAEVAQYLRVRPNLVYAMYRRGEIPGGQRIGRTIRFSSKTIINWLNSGERQRRRRSH